MKLTTVRYEAAPKPIESIPTEPVVLTTPK
jgi:hypothetical protein